MFKQILKLAYLSILLVGTVYAGPKNVIFYIGDGMGFEQVEAAEIFTGTVMSFNDTTKFPYTADCTTYSADNAVTDSAAAATTLATSVKVNNGVISIETPGGGSELLTLLEDAQAQGKSVGLLTTAYLTHATPAAFGAHESSRSNYDEIGLDYLTQTLPNVLFGGGGNGLTVASTNDAGYTVVTDMTGFNALGTTYTHVSAQFEEAYMPYKMGYYDSVNKDYPTYPFPLLNEMTAKAIDILSQDPDGFFLMVEGGRVDHACHSHLIKESVHEVIDFSNAVDTGYNWASGRSDTLILITADHETGGLTVDGTVDADGYPVAEWTTGTHTGTNVPVYACGVNAEMVFGTMDNTDMWEVVTSSNNSGPTAVDDGYIIDEDSSANVLYVLDNDSDPEGDALEIISVTSGTNGASVEILNDGTDDYLSYTPAPDFIGTDVFTYTISDSISGLIDTAQVTVTVVNFDDDPPIADDQSVVTDEDISVGFTLTGSDPEDALLSYEIVTDPIQGILITDNLPEITYDPDDDFSETDSFTFIVFDGVSYSAEATVSITVNSVNDAPVAVADPDIQRQPFYRTNEDASLTVTVGSGALYNDTDIDSASLTAVLVSGKGVANGGLVLDEDGSFTYTPNGDFNGTDTFTYQANDGSLLSNEAVVTITVDSVDDAPLTPSGLIATAGDGVVDLDWDDNIEFEDDLAGYNVYRSLDGSLGTLIGNSLTSDYHDSSVQNDTTYYYSVTAIDSDNDGTSMLESGAATVEATPKNTNYDAYAVDVSFAIGSVTSGSIADTMVIDGVEHVIIEGPDPDGKAGMSRLDVLYTLNTPAEMVDITSLELYWDISWTNTDGDDPLSMEIVDVDGYTLLSISNLQIGQIEVPTSVVQSGGDIHVKFTDTLSVKKETKDTLSIDMLYGHVVVTAPDVTPPDAPDGVMVSGNDLDATVSWDAVIDDDLQGYNVYHSGTKITLIPIADTTYQYYVGVEGVQSYYVTAVDMAGNESGPSDTISVELIDLPPTAPTGLSIQPNNGNILLTWETTETDISFFDIYRIEGSSTEEKIASESGVSYTDWAILDGVNYNYRLVAQEIGAGSRSGFSNPISVTGDNPAPTAPVLSATTNGLSVDLDWDDNTESDASLVTYTVYKSIDGTNFSAVASSLSTSAFTDSDVTDGVTYWYKVAGIDFGSEGISSNVVSVIPLLQIDDDAFAESIALGSKKAGKNYFVNADLVIVTDSPGSNTAIEGAEVVYTWSSDSGTIGTFTGITAGDGSVTLSTKVGAAGTYYFSLDNIVLAGYVYEPSKNTNVQTEITF